jgi:GAF domain-containing protein
VKSIHQSDFIIRIYDPETNLIHFPYTFEEGKRIEIPTPTGPRPWLRAARTAHSRDARHQRQHGGATARYGSFTIPGTQPIKSAIFVPLVCGRRGARAHQPRELEREHAYSDADVRLLQTLAASMSVALDNARLFDQTQRLLKVTEQRAAELAPHQRHPGRDGGGAQLPGNRRPGGRPGARALRFRRHGHPVARRRPASVDILYAYEHGARLQLPSMKPPSRSAFWKLLAARQTVRWNSHADYPGLDLFAIEGTDASRSGVAIPIFVGDRFRGGIMLENYERDDAFSDADARLLGTVAASMGVALENASLFDETQRLLKETEHRSSQLAVINSIQQGMASELNFQAIVDLVGDKLRALFIPAT